jgi:hypothetical protein
MILTAATLVTLASTGWPSLDCTRCLLALCFINALRGPRSPEAGLSCGLTLAEDSRAASERVAAVTGKIALSYSGTSMATAAAICRKQGWALVGVWDEGMLGLEYKRLTGGKPSGQAENPNLLFHGMIWAMQCKFHG